MDTTKENESIFFETYKDAVEYAKRNRGTVLTKNPRGIGFICSNSARTTWMMESIKKKNITEGKPAKSHLPWRDQERADLIKLYKSKTSLRELAHTFERPETGIMAQLKKLQLITAEEHERYLIENSITVNK